MKPTLLLAALFLSSVTSTFSAETAPSTAFDLKKWKLQIPGPKEVKVLDGYSSGYFFMSAPKEMCFHLDDAEKGVTANAHYVRSELRHLVDWKAGDTHMLSAEFRVVSKLTPEKCTALQIHGITESGGDAPPLLRIAVQKGDLVAMIKTDNDGENTDSVPLKKKLGSGYVKVEVQVRNKQLKITVDNQVKLTRSIAFWKWNNYFKAGCYPQATEGVADVFFRKLEVE